MVEIPVHKSSGNIFTDIGFSAAEAAELTAKSRLIQAIAETIKRRRLTQLEAARRCRTDQPTLSKDLRGRMESETIDGLRLGLPPSVARSKFAYPRMTRKPKRGTS